MDYRCWQRLSVLVAIVLLVNTISSHGAPAFKIKHYTQTMHNNFYKQRPPPPRADRRLSMRTSPIYYITPFFPVSHSQNNLENFFVPPPEPIGAPPPSTIYRLPLQMLTNGKPHSVVHGFPKRHKDYMDFFPHSSSSKIIHLPLKYVSNAKPYGVYFKDRSSNFI